MISLDIKATFNSINWNHIETQLQIFQLPIGLRKVISNYLSERTVSCGDATVAVSKGCPQGLVLGPLLWNLGYNYVLDTLHSLGLHVYYYADDTLILLAANDTESL